MLELLKKKRHHAVRFFSPILSPPSIKKYTSDCYSVLNVCNKTTIHAVDYN